MTKRKQRIDVSLVVESVTDVHVLTVQNPSAF